VNQSALPSADQRSGALTAWSQAPVSTCHEPPRSSTAAFGVRGVAAADVAGEEGDPPPSGA
jgi:hypothetical protein